LLSLARDYLQQDRQSYQQAVAPEGRVTGYVTPDGQAKIDERALCRSTLWRFLFFLSTQTVALQVGLLLYAEHDPLSTVHRFLGAVAPHKYRSPSRRDRLQIARRLLHLIDHWERVFAAPFFPRFATRPREP
jgi:hypothetical protein